MKSTRQSDIQIATRVLASHLLKTMRRLKKNPIHPYDGRPVDITIKRNRKFIELKVWYGPMDWGIAAYVNANTGSIVKAGRYGAISDARLGTVLAEDYGVSALIS